MAPADENLCSRAVAYLKARLLEPAGHGISLPHPDSPILTRLNDALVVTYVVDAGDRLRYLQQRDCEGAGLSEQAVHDIGIRNLARLAGERMRVTRYGDIYAVMLDGTFEASLILVDGLWDVSFAALAPHGIVAAIPARDILAFCDATSTEGLAELRQLIERVQGGDHLLTRDLYRRVGGRWEPLVSR